MRIEPKRFETGLAQSTSRGGFNESGLKWIGHVTVLT